MGYPYGFEIQNFKFSNLTVTFFQKITVKKPKTVIFFEKNRKKIFFDFLRFLESGTLKTAKKKNFFFFTVTTIGKNFFVLEIFRVWEIVIFFFSIFVTTVQPWWWPSGHHTC